MSKMVVLDSDRKLVAGPFPSHYQWDSQDKSVTKPRWSGHWDYDNGHKMYFGGIEHGITSEIIEDDIADLYSLIEEEEDRASFAAGRAFVIPIVYLSSENNDWLDTPE